MRSLVSGYRAVVVGASGGIGGAFVSLLEGDDCCAAVHPLSRSGGFDLTAEETIAAAAAELTRYPIDLLLVATGALSSAEGQPEKTIRHLDPVSMAAQFAVNAIGPALVLKHFAPLLPRDRRSLVGVLSARVGSIGDNRLGGWISYRSSKAALNQIVRTAAIELQRSRPQAVLAALHPGTVATRLSDPFAAGRDRFEPLESAQLMLDVLDGLQPSMSGSFHAYDGSTIPW